MKMRARLLASATGVKALIGFGVAAVAGGTMVAVNAFALAPTPDYSGITAEAQNQLTSAPSLVAGLAGPVLGVVMLIVGFGLAVRFIKKAAH